MPHNQNGNNANVDQLPEKPHYGWYHPQMTTWMVLLGILCLVTLGWGFTFLNPTGIILAIIGITGIILCLWPGLGMLIINVGLKDKCYLQSKMELINSIDNPQILDIGCGTGRTCLKVTKQLKHGGYLTGIDIFNENVVGGNSLATVERNAELEGVSAKTSFQSASAIDLPFEKDSFDFVTSSFVMHAFMEQDRRGGNEIQAKVLNGIFRVLKPGGFLIINEFYRPSLLTILFLGPYFWTFPKATYWTNFFKKHHFQNVTSESDGPIGIIIGQKP